MSRTYANFLLFEDVLDGMPEDSAIIMTQAVDMLMNPSVQIVEEDCQTLLGKVVDTNYELEGLTSLATGEIISREYINYLLSNGEYKIRIRELHSCASHKKGGVCQKCYKASYMCSEVPEVGTTLQIPTKLIYQSDTIIGNGYLSVYTLSQTEDDWYDVIVIKDGEVVDTSLYTLGYDYIQFPEVLSTNTTYIVHFFKENTESFQGFISKTYSGGLLGMEPLPTTPTLLRESLYYPMFPDTQVSLLLEELSKLKEIPVLYIDYINRIHDKLEKVLYILYLYALYQSMQD